MFKIRKVKIYAVTMKKVMQRLEELKDIDTSNIQEAIEECFDGYDVEDVEELVGQDSWTDISTDGSHEVTIKINHDDAYEFTIFIETKDNKSSVSKVL